MTTSPQEFYMFAYYLTQCSSVDISLSFLSDGEHVKVGTFQMSLPEVHLLNGIQFILSVHVSRCLVHSHAEMYLSSGPASHITHHLQAALRYLTFSSAKNPFWFLPQLTEQHFAARQPPDAISGHALRPFPQSFYCAALQKPCLYEF